jgi:protocatechuate 3,4-dioxygenase beta subunit
MSENQDGVPLYLDIGVLDTNTCEPLESALVDLWHCNATGLYSSFEPLSPNTPFEELLAQLNITNPQGVDLQSGNTIFFREMWPTDSNGMMERKAIIQRFYVERTMHVHAQVHTNLFIRTNGTVVSDSTISTGQIFFAEDLSEQIMALEPHVSHTRINRTTNAVGEYRLSFLS